MITQGLWWTKDKWEWIQKVTKLNLSDKKGITNSLKLHSNLRGLLREATHDHQVYILLYYIDYLVMSMIYFHIIKK